jgi:hypothetical protein
MSLRSHAVGVALAVTALVGGCGGSDDDDAVDTTTTVEAEPQTSDGPADADDCIAASDQVLASLDVPEAYGFGPLGTLSTGKDAYYVATAAGAVWVTNFDPSTSEAGLILPLNDVARSASEMGADVGPDAPILSGITADSPGAVRAADCARDPEQDG